MLNLVEAPPPKRRDLVRRLRAGRPDLRFLWLPFPVIRMLGGMLKLTLKPLKPGRAPLDLYAAFASERYDTSLAESVIREATSDSARQSDHQEYGELRASARTT